MGATAAVPQRGGEGRGFPLQIPPLISPSSLLQGKARRWGGAKRESRLCFPLLMFSLERDSPVRLSLTSRSPGRQVSGPRFGQLHGLI